MRRADRVHARSLAVFLLFSTCLFEGACTPIGLRDPEMRLRNADALARAGGFERLSSADSEVAGRPIAAWLRPGSAEGCLHVYVEGDGLAWRSRNDPSDDPTPLDPLGLRLALEDPSRATVLYLARPCQFTATFDPACSTPLEWTAARYGEASVKAMSDALDRILPNDGRRDLSLIGYSGGGVMVALLAARRDDVRRFFTIAAPLDVGHWAQETRSSPLALSLSPMLEVARLQSIEQVHFAGVADTKVPLSATQRFVEALGPGATATLRVIEGAGHADWPERWSDLLTDSGPMCGD